MIIVGINPEIKDSKAVAEKLILKQKPTILIHQLLKTYEGGCDHFELSHVHEIPEYQQSYNADLFRFIKKHSIKTVIGCDLPDEERRPRIDMGRTSIIVRQEHRQVELALKYQEEENVIMVVNDIHLRTDVTRVIQVPSGIQSMIEVGRLRASVVRTLNKYRELI